MNKSIVFAICGCFIFFSSIAQSNSEKELLNEIEQNNIKLKAYKSFIESRHLENRGGNNLPDPQLSAYYLPYGTNSSGDYSEIQISQSMEFPSVYKARGKLNDLKRKQLESDYAKIRQDVLLNAQNFIIDLKSLQKQKEIEVLRIEKSKQVYEQMQELFDKEQIGILDLNKAKISWMQEQYGVEQIDINISNTKASLEKLNGGKSIVFGKKDLEGKVEIGPLETIWQEKLSLDPSLKILKEFEATSLQKVQLEKNKVLPNLTIGYNYQGVNGDSFSGLIGGISIPIWSNKGKVKAAHSNYQYHQSNTKEVTSTIFLTFQEQYNLYKLLLNKYIEYQTTIGNLESEKLLFKAYMLGEYSFMEYYVELQFYQQAYDRIIEMEKELHLLRAELLKHQL